MSSQNKINSYKWTTITAATVMICIAAAKVAPATVVTDNTIAAVIVCMTDENMLISFKQKTI